jgi:microsomal dipeptidase-like Zn-dependent dipeptidase
VLAGDLVIDAHVHGPGFVPLVAARLYRAVNRRTMPAEVDLAALADAGVDAVVAKAVGDPVVTRWYGRDHWGAVLRQLDRLVDQVEAAGARLVTTAGQVRASAADGRMAVILGLEGADAVGTDLGRMAQLAGRGVRVVVPVHLGDNQFGTTCLPWQRYIGPLPVRRRAGLGLSPLGAALVDVMDELGIVIDLSHADRATAADIVDRSRHPVIVSHTGARALQDFPRFLADDQISAVAGTGGVMGLWPFCHRGNGVPDLAAIVAHAQHLSAVAGAEHLCLGTDTNGVPGVASGFADGRDAPALAEALTFAGFSRHQVRGVLGENVLRVLDQVSST